MDKIILNVPFFQAPNLIFDADLTAYEKIVYLYLCRCGNNSTAFPSYNTIAKKCGISRRKAIECVGALIEKNYITKEQRINPYDNNNFSNVYKINF